ncbi:MAG TPA: hypothetical protein VGE98_09855 [Thermoanaerobaculia bacterium]
MVNEPQQVVVSSDSTIKPEPGTCPTCISGVDPTIGTGAEFQSALRDSL